MTESNRQKISTRMRSFFAKWLPSREQIKNHFVYSVFGRHLLARDLWHINRHSFAGGVSLGLFIALTPTIPFQMLLTCLGAIYFRVNLPVGLAVCWVTNPLTAMPIYLTAWRTGKAIVARFPFIDDFLTVHSPQSTAGNFMINSLYLWTGAILYAAAAALVSNLLIKFLWKDADRQKHTP